MMFLVSLTNKASENEFTKGQGPVFEEDKAKRERENARRGTFAMNVFVQRLDSHLLPNWGKLLNFG